ncbi:hypothetical protein LTR10_020631 [Elasticomyces elasticus]|uniref:L-gulonate 3-dehydrogenase n=1 Tax=Exophiala sideris TaxID=1016849 RepID=A0ABR0JPD3_9EURO|nr:hypothetical protein LTR10_020631 [Elasticomyces elasticus]KAK5038340.1 hypothetical protein LTS07_001810 [Exophiala sideris]KAK5044324.1 hypothetical protein LTR13_000680 [Exophiala sideris]KAK5067824.1 hypothetical protein LTR69_001813 [Exophiala sideris]KAK5183934.1 hypothetical protein LTR44_003439 [Eurotiomycetes sp. CCFEE 6388]
MSDPDSISSSRPTLPHSNEHITLIGLGAIGISFLALHLTYGSAPVSVYDPRPDLQEHISSVLPLYLSSDTSTPSISTLLSTKRLIIHTSLTSAVANATIIQEQGPESLSFKQKTWSDVLQHAKPTAHLWSSTSGIPASQQLSHLSSEDPARKRLLVVHPFNPPHIMPLLELVPSPQTSPSELEHAKAYFSALNSGHRPITIHKESAGFVANRLSFILFREACHLVNEGVASVEEIDEIVRASLGPRWAVAGPFKMYGFGGGPKGMAGFLGNIGEAIDGVWKDAGRITMDEEGWKRKVIDQTNEAYGLPGAEDIKKRDRGLRAVVKAQEEMEREAKAEREEA